MKSRSQSAEHKRLTGRRPGLDCAGNKIPAPVTRLDSVGMPMAPLTLSEFGKGHWERIWQTPWMLPDYDVAVVTRICEMYEDREAMRARLAQLGLTFASTTGVVHVNPIIDKLARLDAELRKLEAELGLTPASRARLGLTEVKRQSKLDALMRKQSVG